MADIITTAAASATTNLGAPSVPAKPERVGSGLHFERHFTKPGVSPYDEIVWELRDAIIQDFKGKIIFEQKDVEVPADWSMTATNIVASKYLHGQIGTPERESGVRALITRVAESIRDWGITRRLLRLRRRRRRPSTPSSPTCSLNQKVAFNSPVWFNVGCDRLEPNSDAQNWHWNPHDRRGRVLRHRLHASPQCSACFINSVEDSLDSILTLAKTEGMLFKWGSGAGSNLSQHPRLHGDPLRRRHRLRPAQLHARLRRLRRRHQVRRQDPPRRQDGHPQRRPSRHRRLHRVQGRRKKPRPGRSSQAGYDGSGPDSEAYTSIFFQNANNSVRVTDEFMHAVEHDGTSPPAPSRTREPVKEYKRPRPHAQDRRSHLAVRRPRHAVRHHHQPLAHLARTPRRINASNPCSEYMFLDDSACNLASFNLLKFLTPGGQFDIPAYRHAIGVVTTAMEIIVDDAGYPTEMIAKNSHDYRPLGLGYANLGALLMAFGLPYDSDAGRDFAATLTAILCGDAYLQSARIAETCPPLGAATPLTQQAADRNGGACPGFYVNREPFLDVIRMHRAEVNNIGKSPQLRRALRRPAARRSSSTPAATAWDGALAHGEKLRLPQLAGHRPRAHRHHRLHDGLRHHRHRARPRPRQVQEARRRRHDQDRQQHRPRRALQARLHRRRGQRHRQLHRRHRHHRRRARASSPSTSPSSTAPSSPPRAPAPSTTWATSR